MPLRPWVVEHQIPTEDSIVSAAVVYSGTTALLCGNTAIAVTFASLFVKVQAQVGDTLSLPAFAAMIGIPGSLLAHFDVPVMVIDDAALAARVPAAAASGIWASRTAAAEWGP
ncbi:hypothetical protein G6O67_008665 [Ophiocordyceps sinensis]|uniref:Uncharacterized protein n=1 Tax=Ophiocordyceps sinensis TaxID=72228 RepID=A0A8H4LRZ1_9HYPO|nr:hypothetical protein G6O67_008665 [Ophiocordyceps sinensis]